VTNLKIVWPLSMINLILLRIQFRFNNSSNSKSNNHSYKIIVMLIKIHISNLQWDLTHSILMEVTWNEILEHQVLLKKDLKIWNWLHLDLQLLMLDHRLRILIQINRSLHFLRDNLVNKLILEVAILERLSKIKERF